MNNDSIFLQVFGTAEFILLYSQSIILVSSEKAEKRLSNMLLTRTKKANQMSQNIKLYDRNYDKIEGRVISIYHETLYQTKELIKKELEQIDSEKVAYHLKRNLEHAPIYEWNSEVDGYTLYFPVIKTMGECNMKFNLILAYRNLINYIVKGTRVWGNIILNINPLNENAISWIPYVFAHKYHQQEA